MTMILVALIILLVNLNDNKKISSGTLSLKLEKNVQNDDIRYKPSQSNKIEIGKIIQFSNSCNTRGKIQ